MATADVRLVFVRAMVSKSFQFRLLTLFLLPILIALPATWWHQQLRDYRAEQELMNLLPHGAGVDFDRCGPKWIGWFAPSQMMRVVAVDVSGLSPRRATP